MSLREIFDLVGFSDYRIGYGEVLISTAGGALGIAAILVISHWAGGNALTVLIVPSMGASAVLLFAAPHAPFSQPWNVAAGHLLSAVVGVACWRWIPDAAVAAVSSVGLAIGAMYVARCIHPPGGATALAAVIGSDHLHQLGFAYVVQPILLNVVAIMAIAVLFNGLFRWRRYPAHLRTKTESAEPEFGGYTPINHEDFVFALSQIDTFVDVTEEDLLKIYQLATRRHQALPRNADAP